ncbi:MAG TPA: hypothetical protein VN257_11210 [Actinotalea sp.]|nr:hypothetical protein [Actinotalea sp.]
MIIDCGQCTARGDACRECVVTFLTVPVRNAGDGGTTGPSAGPRVPDRAVGPVPDLDEAEREAIAVLAACGLVPPLRMRAV